MKVREYERDKNRKKAGGGGCVVEFCGGDIYGTGERNPWEFCSLAFELNSSRQKRQTLSSGLLLVKLLH